VAKTKKPVIAIDIDDCLAKFAERVVAYGNKHWGHNIETGHYDEDWFSMWDVGHAELQRRIDKMFFDESFYPTLSKIDGASETLWDLTRDYKLVVMTARSEALLRDVTCRWIDENYPGLIDEIYFLGDWGSVKEYDIYRTKADMCGGYGVEYLIDDQPKHVNGAAERGVKALLYGNYGWNHQAAVHKSVVRVKDWEAVKNYFEGRQKYER